MCVVGVCVCVCVGVWGCSGCVLGEFSDRALGALGSLGSRVWLVKLVNLETDEQMSFSSYSEAGRFLTVQAADISTAKKKQTLVKGWKVIG